MDQIHYKEMKENLERLIIRGVILEKEIYIFGHCNASEELAELLMDNGYSVVAILDNNIKKQGDNYKGIPIVPPQLIMKRDMKRMLICIVSRAYEAMAIQLKQMGYIGSLEKLVDYNTFAEFSLSQETIERKEKRVIKGIQTLKRMQMRYKDCFYILCPFSALGDVYYVMAYLPYYLEKKRIEDYVVITVGKACSDIAAMFDCPNIEALDQQEMDELVQAVLYTREKNVFIAHHDRPYANLLSKALYVRLIPFEDMYRCGVFGLGKDCAPYHPTVLQNFHGLASIERGKAVVLAPYVKSVAEIGEQIWEQIIEHYQKEGYRIYTNIVGEETALPGTFPLRASLMELQSVVEWGGTFIGVRNGLCDVIRGASCRKVVLFPDCYYSDTQWKVADFFRLEGWENIVVKQEEISNL